MIKSNAAPDEISSPFYLKNESFCRTIEKYVINKKGEIKGSYNAWSYLIYGKINFPKQWVIKYKKATFTNGNLLLSSKHMNLSVLAEWKTKLSYNFDDFSIRQKTKLDRAKIKFSDEFNYLDKQYHNYIIHSKDNENYLIKTLVDTMNNVFKKEEVYQIEFTDNTLRIEFRTENDYLEILEQLSELLT